MSAPLVIESQAPLTLTYPKDKVSDEEAVVLPEVLSDQPNPPPTRPPIDWSSPTAFAITTAERFRSIWTRRFVLSLLAGQLVSLCITCTNVTTTELVSRNWALPTTQTFFLYFSLFVIYTPYTIYQCMFPSLLRVLDILTQAYEYTTLLSCMLLDAWAIPVCVAVSWLLMRPKYKWTQLLGIFVCVGGLGMLVASDQITDKDWPALNRAKGDVFMIVGATLYGFTNATEEFFVRKSPLYEVVGQLGMWGTIINGIQASALEYKGMRTATWNGANIGLLCAYTAAMFILYTVAPILYRMASSAYYNLSLLSSDFYGLLFGLFLYHYHVYFLYFIAFAVIISGLVIYFWSATPEDQGTINPQAPTYVEKRRNENDERVVGRV